MPTIHGILIALLAAVAMEGVAFATHRFIMHGPMWFLHRSHHEPRHGPLEKNDWFVVVFASPSVALIYMGAHLRMSPIYLSLGIGIALYGLIYFLVHDVLVHRRIAHRFVPRSRYLRRIVGAHRLHHAVESRDGCVSFGFLYARPARALKAELAQSPAARLRAPVARGRVGIDATPS